jgi:AcrR family transcriptional regulator
MAKDLLEAARTVFLANGYKHTNVSKITKEAGIATGSFYKYYDSKQAIFLAVYEQENAKLREPIIQQLKAGVGLAEGVDLIINSVFNAVRKNRVLMEWYGQDIGQLLHENYEKEMSAGAYGFGVELQQWLAKQTQDLSLNEKQQAYLERGVQFLNNLDQVLSESAFLNETETLQLMVHSYIETYVLEKRV